MAKTYLVRWKNGDATILQMESDHSEEDLFIEIDKWGDPHSAKITILPKMFALHAEKDMYILDGETTHASPRDAKEKRFRFSEGILFRSHGLMRAIQQRHDCGTLQQLMPNLKKPPTDFMAIEQVKKCQPFSGVYFAWGKDGRCDYVGKSNNVPQRVSKSRPELASDRITFLKFPEHEISWAEICYIGMLRPRFNAETKDLHLMTSHCDPGTIPAQQVDESDPERYRNSDKQAANCAV
jgi:hypothetical protein